MGRGETRQDRKKKDGECGAELLCRLNKPLISTAKHRGVHCENVWKPLIGPVLPPLLHGGHKAPRSDVSLTDLLPHSLYVPLMEMRPDQNSSSVFVFVCVCVYFVLF